MATHEGGDRESVTSSRSVEAVHAQETATLARCISEKTECKAEIGQEPREKKDWKYYPSICRGTLVTGDFPGGKLPVATVPLLTSEGTAGIVLWRLRGGIFWRERKKRGRKRRMRKVGKAEGVAELLGTVHTDDSVGSSRSEEGAALPNKMPLVQFPGGAVRYRACWTPGPAASDIQTWQEN